MLLKVPPPAVIDHAPVDALPPTLAPVKVMAVGAADWQAVKVAPGVTVGAGLILIVRVALTGTQEPAGSFVVKVNVMVPLKLAAGVYVTVEGLATKPVLLKVPPPDVIDHAPVPALPPTLAPAKVMAVGAADSQTVKAAPGVTVAAGLIVIVLVALTALQVPGGSSVVNVSVTVPVKLAAGV